MSNRTDSAEKGNLPAPLVGPTGGREPLHEWRGFMLDSARSFFDVETVLDVLHLLHRYGFNRFHWHLTDDAGWRFDVPEYPKLAEVSATLPRMCYKHYGNLAGDTYQRALDAAPTRWHNGFYSEDDIAQVVDVAQQLGIEIIPEVDLPGHMAAAIAAYPELGQPDNVNNERNDLLWPTDEAAKFVRAVVNRIMDLFPGKRVHVGGDECAYKQWMADPEMPTWFEKRGVANERELQAWFLAIAQEEITSRGRQVCAWDEVSATTDDASILMFAWEGANGTERIERVSNEFVFADTRYLYLDHWDPDSDYVSGLGAHAGTSVRTILEKPWQLAESDRCVGVQACVWTEFILNRDELFTMVFPRLLAVSERLWNAEIDVEDAVQRVNDEYRMLLGSGTVTRCTPRD